MKELIPIPLFTVPAGGACAALQPADELPAPEHVGPELAEFQFYTPPIMLYGKPVPPDPNAQMPNWVALFQPIRTTPDSWRDGLQWT